MLRQQAGRTATAWGDVPKLAELLAGEDDDGRGVDLRTFRTSWDDVDYLWRARKVSIDPHCTLIELALARDHSDVVSLLLADDGPVCVTSTPSAPRAPPDVRRAISSFVAPAHADEVRSAAA